MKLGPEVVKKYQQILGTFLGQGQVVLADPSQSMRGSFARILSLLGVSGAKLRLAPTIEDLRALMGQPQTRLIICDLEWAKITSPSHDRVVVACAQGLAPWEAAECAELGVDLVLVKPFVLERVVVSLVEALQTRPGRRGSLDWIQKGKMASREGKWKDAMESFLVASRENRAVHRTPFVLLPVGSPVSTALDRLVSDRVQFLLDLEISKALAGLGRSEEAFQRIQKSGLQEAMTPEQFTDWICLLVRTRNFEALDRDYPIFSAYERRPPALVRAVTAALVVAGKAALRMDRKELALERFRRAAISCNHQPQWLDGMIKACLEKGYVVGASELLSRYPKSEREQGEFRVLEYDLFNRTAPVHDVVQQGWKLIQAGKTHPLIFKILIARLEEVGWLDSAENLKFQMNQLYPEVGPESPFQKS